MSDRAALPSPPLLSKPITSEHPRRVASLELLMQLPTLLEDVGLALLLSPLQRIRQPRQRQFSVAAL